ncbi:MAG: glycosyltransferase [Thermoplasmata archaeon]
MPSRASSTVSRAKAAGKGLVWDLVRHKTVSLPPSGQARGRVLLSYITAPFSSSPKDGPANHSNLWECSEIARTFQGMGYAVDVIDWDDSAFVPSKEYDIFIDIHANMERLDPLVGARCLKVLHVTGSHWLHQNRAEYGRLESIRQRRGVSLRPRRQVQPVWGIEAADCATVLGNDTTTGTWKYAGKRMFRIPATSPIYPEMNPGKDFSACKNRFVWLGSSGLALKGLDLALEAFAGMPDMHLTVCGPVGAEEDFARAYGKELEHSYNIESVGWVDVFSDRFRSIADGAVGMVYPSASEGASIAVLTCMSAGLIPIATPQSGIDISPSGTVLRDASVGSVQEAVRALSRLSPDELRSRATQARSFVNERHSRKAFTEAYSGAAREMVRMASERK